MCQFLVYSLWGLISLSIHLFCFSWPLDIKWVNYNLWVKFSQLLDSKNLEKNKSTLYLTTEWTIFLKNSTLKHIKPHRKSKGQYPWIASWPHNHGQLFCTAVHVLAEQDRTVAANTESLGWQHLLLLRKSPWLQLQRIDPPRRFTSALSTVWVSEQDAFHTAAHTKYVIQKVIGSLEQCCLFSIPSLDQSWRTEMNSILCEGSKLSLIPVTPNRIPLQKIMLPAKLTEGYCASFICHDICIYKASLTHLRMYYCHKYIVFMQSTWAKLID